MTFETIANVFALVGIAVLTVIYRYGKRHFTNNPSTDDHSTPMSRT